jgi:hypothetical protein
MNKILNRNLIIGLLAVGFSSLLSVKMVVIVGLVLLCGFVCPNESSEEEKEQVLNKKYSETNGTFESFLECRHTHNPSVFHRCPRPYDSRYSEKGDFCIYCNRDGSIE